MPEPKIVWFKDGQEVRSDARIKIQRDSQRLETYNLTLNLIKREEAGVYEMKASNTLGTAVCKSVVIVNSKYQLKKKSSTIKIFKSIFLEQRRNNVFVSFSKMLLCVNVVYLSHGPPFVLCFHCYFLAFCFFFIEKFLQIKLEKFSLRKRYPMMNKSKPIFLSKMKTNKRKKVEAVSIFALNAIESYMHQNCENFSIQHIVLKTMVFQVLPNKKSPH